MFLWIFLIQVESYIASQAVDEVDVNGNFFVADLIEPHDVHPRRIGLEPALAARFGDAIVGRSAFLGFEAYMNAAGCGCAVGIANLHVDLSNSGRTATGGGAPLRPK